MPFDGAESPFYYLGKIDEVIDLVEAPGQWTQRIYRNRRGQYCLKEVLNMVGVAQVLEPVILRAAADITGKEFCCVESFNDMSDTTQRDVVSVLRRVRDDVAAGRTRLPASSSPPLLLERASPTNRFSKPFGLLHQLFS